MTLVAELLQYQGGAQAVTYYPGWGDISVQTEERKVALQRV